MPVKFRNPRIDTYRGVNIGICIQDENPYPGVMLYKDVMTPTSVKVYLLDDGTWDRSHHIMVRHGLKKDIVDRTVKYINDNKNAYFNIISGYYDTSRPRFKEDTYYDNYGNYRVTKWTRNTEFLSLEYKTPIIFGNNVYNSVYEAVIKNKGYFLEHSIKPLLFEKFRNEELKKRLLDTGNGEILISYGCDRRAFHMKGYYDNGPNCLGNLLTSVRNVLRRC